jgi:predicted transglutaminase-like cysteine proteinase
MRGQIGLGIALGAFVLAGCQSVPDNLQSANDQPLPGVQTAAFTSSTLMSSTSMPEGRPSEGAPPGFVSFCYRFADQCAASPNDPAVVHLDMASQAVLERVNYTVNVSMRPEDDEHHYGCAEYWNIPSDGKGSGQDYALTKRRDLINAGFSPRALRVAIVATPRNTRQAVLTVVTDRGDLVLDSLTNEIKPWTDTRYSWIARQDGKGELGWVTLASGTDDFLLIRTGL